MDCRQGNRRVTPLLLGCAVLFWSAGFDILYALQDLDFDRASGLHSLPVRLGVQRSLAVARLFHMVMIGLLLLLLFTMHLGALYLLGLSIAAILLTYEHRLLRNGDLSKLDTAFFNMNGYISLTVFLFHHRRPAGLSWRGVMSRHVVVAITGASGVIYGLKLCRELLATDTRLTVLISPAGHQVLTAECGLEWQGSETAVLHKLQDYFQAGKGKLVYYAEDNFQAPVASGSNAPDAMIICPCSMGTLSRVASGISGNLLERCADVVLKERRRWCWFRGKRPCMRFTWKTC